MFILELTGCRSCILGGGGGGDGSQGRNGCDCHSESPAMMAFILDLTCCGYCTTQHIHHDTLLCSWFLGGGGGLYPLMQQQVPTSTIRLGIYHSGKGGSPGCAAHYETQVPEARMSKCHNCIQQPLKVHCYTAMRLAPDMTQTLPSVSLLRREHGAPAIKQPLVGTTRPTLTRPRPLILAVLRPCSHASLSLSLCFPPCWCVE